MAETRLAKKGKSGGLAKAGQWKEEMRGYAEKTAAQEQLAGNFISFKAGKIRVAGNDVKSPVRVVVLGAVFENALYTGAYDADSPRPPTCYAFAEEKDQLAPHEKVKKPFNVELPDDEGEFSEQELEPEQCKGCPCNEFGTGRDQQGNQSRGKVCKNIKRLAIISAGSGELTEKQILTSEMYFAKVPVTSVNAWAQYAKAVPAEHGVPYFGVVTMLHCESDPDKQVVVSFSDPEPLPEELHGALIQRHKEAMESLVAPYPEAREQPAKPAKGKKGKPAAKPAAAGAGRRKF